MNQNDNIRYSLSVRLFKGEKCFGPGIAELLHLVDTHRSLRSAAAEMDMAYSKAWRIVKEMGATLGFPLLNTATGGVNGGGATLTDEARTLLENYTAFIEETRKSTDEIFNRYFM